jgi:kinesin family protein 15
LWGCAQVLVRVRPSVSRLVDGKDLWFVHRITPDSAVVRGGWRPRQQGYFHVYPVMRGSEQILQIGGCLQADAFDLVGLSMIGN